MYFVAYFTNSGTPATGLSPTITIWKVSDNSVLVNAAAMTEIAGGFYKYDYGAYDPTVDVVARADGGATLSGYDRYPPGIPRDDIEIADKVPDNYFMGSSVSTDKDDEIDDIKTVTDNLPNSGALTDIDGGINNIEAKLPTNYIMGSSDQSDKDDEIDAIKAKTDNLPTDTEALLNQMLGLADKNSYIDNWSFDGSSRMTGCRKRVYDSKTNAEAHGATGLLYTFTITVSYSGDDIASYLVVLE